MTCIRGPSSLTDSTVSRHTGCPATDQQWSVFAEDSSIVLQLLPFLMNSSGLCHLDLRLSMYEHIATNVLENTLTDD